MASDATLKTRFPHQTVSPHRVGAVDQAEGLRRLLVSNQTRVITVVAGKSGVGRTSMTINLAAALARSGKDVLVLDENHAPNNLLDRLGLYARHDLLDVIQGVRYEGYERTIDTHIKNLRSKIEANPRKPRYIETVYGVGYRINRG